MFFEPKNGHGLPHNPVAACVAPRPIGWISTLSKDGIGNLAPFSWLFSPQRVGHCQKPPLSGIHAATVFFLGAEKGPQFFIFAVRV